MSWPPVTVNEFRVVSHHQRRGGGRDRVQRCKTCPLCCSGQRAAIKARLRQGIPLVQVAQEFELDKWYQRKLDLGDGVTILRRSLKAHPTLMKEWLEATKGA